MKILDISATNCTQGSKLKTIINLLVLLRHIRREELLGVMEKDSTVRLKNQRLRDALQIFELRQRLAISLIRLIESLELLKLALIKKFIKRLNML